jgi:hypothetical protein
MDGIDVDLMIYGGTRRACWWRFQAFFQSLRVLPLGLHGDDERLHIYPCV